MISFITITKIKHNITNDKRYTNTKNNSHIVTYDDSNK